MMRPPFPHASPLRRLLRRARDCSFTWARVGPIALVALVGACGEPDAGDEPELRMTINELLLENARTCNSGFEYPSSLVEGIGTQLVEELRCLDDNWLEFYTPCREPGCIWADGPQPLAMRPEVIVALRAAATYEDDFISITAAYRDVAMQYYSRWYKENCNSAFDAEIPGRSNHQGGRAVDVRYYDYWEEAMLANGFNRPIPGDLPHYELVEDAAYREESEELKQLSILAFERLWNRNNPDDTIPEDGVYDEATKLRLGQSPVEGFTEGACAPGSGGEPDAGWDLGPPPEPDATPDADTTDTSSPDTTPPDALGPDTARPDTAAGDTASPDVSPDAGGPDTGADARFDAHSVPNPLGTAYRAAPTPPGVTVRGCASSRGGRAPLGVGLFALAAWASRRRYISFRSSSTARSSAN